MSLAFIYCCDDIAVVQPPVLASAQTIVRYPESRDADRGWGTWLLSRLIDKSRTYVLAWRQITEVERLDHCEQANLRPWPLR